MKKTAGAAAAARSKRSRTRLAPMPTKTSTNALPLILKKGTCASPATARAKRVLPVPGGPTSRAPVGAARGEPLVAEGMAQDVDLLSEFLFGAVRACHITEGGLGLLL